MSEAAARPFAEAAPHIRFPLFARVALSMGVSPTAVRRDWAWVDALDAMRLLDAKAESAAVMQEEARHG